MANLIEKAANDSGETYELYETGRSFKSVITYPGRALKSGKKIDSYKKEVRHAHMGAVLGSKYRKMFQL